MQILPVCWKNRAPSIGGQGGEQFPVVTEHQHVSEAGVGQGRARSADTEEVVAQNHCSSLWNRGTFRKRLIYAGERGDEGAQWVVVQYKWMQRESFNFGHGLQPNSVRLKQTGSQGGHGLHHYLLSLNTVVKSWSSI